MPPKQNPAPLAGGNRAGTRYAQQQSNTSVLASDQDGPIAVIPKNKLEEIRVELSEFNGHDLINIRIWADRRDGDGARIPTKAGIACNVRLLPDLITALANAERVARERGLL
jgi:hypothetical protein